MNIGALTKGDHTSGLELDPDMKLTDPPQPDRDTHRVFTKNIPVCDSYLS